MHVPCSSSHPCTNLRGGWGGFEREEGLARIAVFVLLQSKARSLRVEGTVYVFWGSWSHCDSAPPPPLLEGAQEGTLSRHWLHPRSDKRISTEKENNAAKYVVDCEISRGGHLLDPGHHLEYSHDAVRGIRHSIARKMTSIITYHLQNHSCPCCCLGIQTGYFDYRRIFFILSFSLSLITGFDFFIFNSGFRIFNSARRKHRIGLIATGLCVSHFSCKLWLMKWRP